VCFHQGFQDRTCVATDPEHPGEGTPDDRPCVLHTDCNGPGAEPGQEYKCEKVGLFGSFSVEDRVRYRGELHDPNELSMTVSVGGFAFLLAFMLIKRNVRWTLLGLIGTVIVFGTVVMSQSRGGQAVFLLIIGVFFVKRFGVAGLVVGALLALPVLALGGRSGAAADESTALRYDAWLAGLGMLKSSPIFGVGHRLFTQHHFMTAHNSYVLTLAELGLVGCFLFVTLLWMSVKTLWTGVRDLEDVPGAEVARVWGLTLLASFVGLIFQINTLSFAYHTVLWIFFGLAGAYASAVRHHRPEFRVRMTARDLLLVATIVLAYAFVVLPIFLRWKGAS
jgi:O-antigen ligase